MIIYVNGDSHSAGAEIVNGYCFAEDDPLYYALGRQPHPKNLESSYGCEIANHLGAVLDCDAESASSNDRILRTTCKYVAEIPELPNLVIIGWSTWEREEWHHRGQSYQVTASGTDSVPPELKERYKQWVIEQSYPNIINQKTVDTHNKIWALHRQLKRLDVPHIFFNTYSTFSNIKNLAHLGAQEYDWNDCYIDPYSQDGAYYHWCLNNGFKTVRPDSYHFGADAHRAWANFIVQNYSHRLLTEE